MRPAINNQWKRGAGSSFPILEEVERRVSESTTSIFINNGVLLSLNPPFPSSFHLHTSSVYYHLLLTPQGRSYGSRALRFIYSSSSLHFKKSHFILPCFFNTILFFFSDSLFLLLSLNTLDTTSKRERKKVQAMIEEELYLYREIGDSKRWWRREEEKRVCLEEYRERMKLFDYPSQPANKEKVSSTDLFNSILY